MRAAVAAALLACAVAACLSPPDERGSRADGAPGGDLDGGGAGSDAGADGGAQPACAVDLDFSESTQLDDWDANDESDCNCGISGGEVVIDNSGGGVDPTCRCFYVSPPIELTDTQTSMQLSTPGEAGLAVSLTLDLRGVDRGIYFSRTRDVLYFGDCNAGECVNTEHGQIDYVHADMQWWRFTHYPDGARVAFETSPDGADWTEQAFAPVTAEELVGAGLAIGAFDPADAPIAVVGLDNLSVCDAP